MATPFPWFKVFVGVSSHLKVRRLARLLACEEVAALGWMVRLWESTTKYAPGSGVFAGALDAAELEADLSWQGAPGALLKAFTDVGLLERGMKVHEWTYHQPALEKLVDVREPPGSSDRQRDRQADSEPSQYFLKWWAMVPPGKKHGNSLAYRAWRRHGLDQEDDAGAAERETLYETFRAQLANEHWRSRWMNNGTALSYVRHCDWRQWHAEDRRSGDRGRAGGGGAGGSGGGTVSVPIVDIPQRRDSTDLRADWRSLSGNESREFPGPEKAYAEVVAALLRGKAAN